MSESEQAVFMKRGWISVALRGFSCQLVQMDLVAGEWGNSCIAMWTLLSAGAG